MALIAEHMLTCLKAIHVRNFIHCDIKPANILVGNTTCHNMLYLADFSSAHQYRDASMHIHILF
ncbi:hypothetical protein JVU11DRAFT_10625 [Chiua virens]|nr:hypothetical protein JVU11DRAFT_10625 [Chiua virens]